MKIEKWLFGAAMSITLMGMPLVSGSVLAGVTCDADHWCCKHDIGGTGECLKCCAKSQPGNKGEGLQSSCKPLPTRYKRAATTQAMDPAKTGAERAL